MTVAAQCGVLVPVFTLFPQEEEGEEGAEGAEGARGERERRAGETGQSQSRVRIPSVQPPFKP